MWISRRIWNGNVCDNYKISHHCPSRMAGLEAVGLLPFQSFWYGNKALWECEIGVEVEVRIHVASSITLSPFVATILRSGVLLCSRFSFFAFFFFVSLSGTYLSWGGTVLLSFFFCVWKNRSLKILTDLYVKKSEDILCCSEYRIKANLPNLDSKRLLWDYIFSF